MSHPLKIAVLSAIVLSVLSAETPGLEPVSVSPDSIVLEDFSVGGAFPVGWKVLDSDRWPVARSTYTVVNENPPHLRATHRGSEGTPGTQIVKEISWDVRRYPILRWRWRARSLPPGGSEMRGSKTNDSAAALYVIYDLQNLIFTKLPTYIKYVWSTTVPVNTKIQGRLGRFKIKVAESGGANLGRWVTEDVDVYNDYRDFFNKNPGRNAVAIAIMVDADATRGVSSADFGPIIAMTREASAATKTAQITDQSSPTSQKLSP